MPCRRSSATRRARWPRSPTSSPPPAPRWRKIGSPLPRRSRRPPRPNPRQSQPPTKSPPPRLRNSRPLAAARAQLATLEKNLAQAAAAASTGTKSAADELAAARRQIADLGARSSTDATTLSALKAERDDIRFRLQRTENELALARTAVD